MMQGSDLHARLAMDVQGLSRLRQQAADTPDAALREASVQFEALFLQQMLKSMRDAVPRAGLVDSSQLRLHESMLDQQLSVHLAGHGAGRGIGLAEQLVRQLGGDSEPVIRPRPLWGAVSPVTPPAAKASPENFVERLAPAAQAASEKSGVPARLVLAQAALETGWGQHEIRTGDGRNSHNLFGIKAGASWQGESTGIVTHEYIDGERQRVSDRFRVYPDYTAAMADHARLIGESPRYAAVRDATSEEDAARALQAGGYATDPAYADKLIAIMRQIRLPNDVATPQLAALK